MSDREFMILLALFMVSDPWPLTQADHDYLEDYLNKQSQARGFENWIEAYHEFGV